MEESPDGSSTELPRFMKLCSPAAAPLSPEKVEKRDFFGSIVEQQVQKLEDQGSIS